MNSAWLKLALTGVAGALLVSACVIKEGDDDDDPVDEEEDTGGRPSTGGRASTGGTSSSTGGSSTTGGTSSSTGGSSTGGTSAGEGGEAGAETGGTTSEPVICDDSGEIPELCTVMDPDDCWSCMMQDDACCPELAACLGENEACSYGGFDIIGDDALDGELICVREAVVANIGAGNVPSPEELSDALAECQTAQCVEDGFIISQKTVDAAECMTDLCAAECY